MIQRIEQSAVREDAPPIKDRTPDRISADRISADNSPAARPATDRIATACKTAPRLAGTDLKSRSFFISTYGCQMNVNDTERMSALLEMAGFAPAPSPESAELVIINSCSIREKPVHKLRSEAGLYRRLKEKNPRFKLGIAGCAAQQEKQRLFQAVPFLNFVMGTDAIDELPQIVARLDDAGAGDSEGGGKKRLSSVRQRPKEPYHIQTLIRNPKVTAFVNISKGCDNFCTFCVVPFTRGRERSRPLTDILKDARALGARGVKEITLLGQNVNSYRSPCGADFGRLLQTLAEEGGGIQRIRFTTPHPKDFNEELVDIMRTHRDKIMDCVHLPAQSGNTEILRRMNRGYSREEYVEKARMIQERLPGAALSTDIITGFPGETEARFEDSLSLLDEVPFESLFSFKYSPRPGTKARLFEDQVPEKEKARRLTALQNRHKTIAFQLAKKYKGRVLDVLTEKQDEKTGRFMGRSTQNKLVYFSGSKEDTGRIVSVRITKTHSQTFYGEKICRKRMC